MPNLFPEAGGPLSELCSFCDRRTYAGMKGLKSWNLEERIACPRCYRSLREERCEKGLDESLPNCECLKCKLPWARSRKVLNKGTSHEPDPPPAPAPPDVPNSFNCTCLPGVTLDPTCPAHGEPAPPVVSAAPEWGSASEPAVSGDGTGQIHRELPQLCPDLVAADYSAIEARGTFWPERGAVSGTMTGRWWNRFRRRGD